MRLLRAGNVNPIGSGFMTTPSSQELKKSAAMQEVSAGCPGYLMRLGALGDV
jgi:hypothetical protein